MDKRRLGRTNHESTLAIFGAAALGNANPEVTEQAMELILRYGVNHIDVAPSYGIAETLLGPWMPDYRKKFFLACKTGERKKEAAAAELRGSLKRLQTERFDLFQLHAVTSMDELDAVTMAGGALEAVIEAKEEGLTDFIGITGHGYEAPEVFLEALKRFDFDTVMFPMNFIQMRDDIFRSNVKELIDVCKQKDVGVMIIKSIAQGPWGDKAREFNTWYEPLSMETRIKQAVHYVLSQPVTGICTAGDVTLLPFVLEACKTFEQMDKEAMTALSESAGSYDMLFKPGEKLI